MYQNCCHSPVAEIKLGIAAQLLRKLQSSQKFSFRIYCQDSISLQSVRNKCLNIQVQLLILGVSKMARLLAPVKVDLEIGFLFPGLLCPFLAKIIKTSFAYVKGIAFCHS